MSLVAWFPLDNDLHNQGAGNSQISLYNGSYGGWSSGKVTNRSLHLGSGTISIPNPLIELTEWTIAFWYKANTPATWSDIFTIAGNSQRVEFSAANGANLTWYINGIFTSGTLLVDGLSNSTWYHIIITFNNGISTFYLNGVQKVQQTGRTTFTSSEDKIYFGSRINTSYCAIDLNDLRLYNHALSVKEVKELAKGLVAHYKFNFEDLYIPVNYLESTGTQYINTEIVHDNSISTKVILEQLYTTTSPSYQIIGFTGNAGSGIGTSGSSWWEISNPSSLFTYRIYNLEWYKLGANWSRKIDGVETTGTNGNTNIGSSNPMLLFAAWSSAGSTSVTYYCSARLYSCKIYQNDVLVRDFIPCMRKIDLKPGLYDTINNRFYTNSGSGDFNTPIRYIPINSIASSGSQYINTEIALDLNTDGFEITAQPSTASQNGVILGNWVESNNYYWLYHYTSSGIIRMYLTNANHSQVYFDLGLSSSNTSKHTYEFKGGRMRVDGGEWKFTNTGTAHFSTSTTLCYLFRANGSNGNSYLYKGNIFSCKLYKKGKCVKDFIPAIRLQDREAGMLDMISGNFYTNQGTGTFTSVLYPQFTTMNDNSGYDNTITISSILQLPTQNTAIGNCSLSFPSGTYLRLAKELLNTTNKSFTISVWAKTSSSASQCLFCDRGGAGTGPALFLLNGNQVRFDTVDTNCSTSFTYGNGAWNLYTCTFDGSTRKIYINGLLMTSLATTSLGTLGGVLSIGGSYASSSNTTPNGNYFVGQLADWRLYATALSANDVLELYNSKAMIDKSGNLYCNDFIESGNDVILPTKTSLVEANNLVENTPNLMLQNGYTQLSYIDQVNPAAGATSQHNRCAISSLQYNYIEARVNVNGTGTSGGIMLAGYNGSWWKSWQGGGTSTITMTPATLTQNAWIDVTWKCDSTYNGLWTSGWSDGTNYWTPQNLKVAYIKTYLNQTLTGYFVPVRRNKDNALGLYNMVTQTFYPNAGTGSFSAGDVINKLSTIYTNNLIEC